MARSEKRSLKMPWGTGNPVLLFNVIFFIQYPVDNHNGGVHPGGRLSYERGGDASRKFCIKPLKETNLGKAQTF